MNSEKIFESILNEKYHYPIAYPTTATFKNGKPKKILLLLKYIYENPGCTKKDITTYLATQGLGKLPDESWAELPYDDIVKVVRVGSINKYFPTEKLLSYLKSINFIELDSSEEIRYNTKSVDDKRKQKELYDSVIDTISDYPLNNQYIIEVLNKVIQYYQK